MDKDCVYCSKAFAQKTAFHKYCSAGCAIKDIKKSSKPVKRSPKVKNKSYYLNKLQSEFNRYIRHRDKDDPCISCLQYRTNYHAGHYLCVGSHPELRFDEDNVHKQCIQCNLYRSGNLLAYRNQLMIKIGPKKLEALEAAHPPQHYSIDDLIVLIDHYKTKNASAKSA